MVATVHVVGHVLDVANAHPESRSAGCRLASIRQIFEDTGQHHGPVREEQALLLGDLNLDPWRGGDVCARCWRIVVSTEAGSDYGYHSGAAERQPPYPTLRYLTYARAYDHVVSNVLHGVTHVLGESPGPSRLDGENGLDHRPVFGRLSWEPSH
jgi:endonuclease/exonuclease/phosphatase family metal-dependent hydrolase